MAVKKKKVKKMKSALTKKKSPVSKKRTLARKVKQGKKKKSKAASKKIIKKAKAQKKPKGISKKTVKVTKIKEENKSQAVSKKAILNARTQKKSVSLDQTLELEKAAFYLEDLLASLKSGTVCIQQGENVVTLHPGQIVDFEVEATSKKSKEKLILELSWRTDRKEEKDFKILPREPVKTSAGK